MLIKVRSIVLPVPKRYNFRSYSTAIAPKEQKVKVKNLDINYVKVGTGPHTVLCLPGALGTIWTDFKPQIEGFDREKFTVVAWDPPGYGKSRPPERDFSGNYHEKDSEVFYEFMKVLNISKCSLLGWSDGAITSLHLAAKHPDAINNLALFGFNSFIPLENVPPLSKHLLDLNSWSERIKQPLIDIYGKDHFKNLMVHWIDSMVNLLIANNGNICSHLLKDIKCPTLILYGKKDPIVNSAQIPHQLTHIQKSRVHIFPEGNHNLHLRFSEEFNKIVQEFLLTPSNC